MAKTKSSRASARRSSKTAPSRRVPARPKKAAAKKTKPARGKPGASAGEISFTLDARKEGLEPILGAAYLLMDRAYAFIDGDKSKILTVTLRPKGERGAPALAALK